ncbi:MAG: lysophospholipid acyltransferase family protein, partial [Pseudomonadota bacterium]
MQTLRSIVYVAWLYGALLVLGVLFLPTLFLPRRVVRKGMEWWAVAARWGLKWICGVRTEYRGLDRLPQGPCIIAPKHQCMYDTIAPFEWLKDPAFVLKKELMILPILGWYSWKADMIAIDRGGALKTMKALTKKARQVAADGRQLIIFPEGTRGAPGD